MVLESTIICCDNSEFQRNGDYQPTRLIAQSDAINLISLSKFRSHPENDVALMTIANSVQVLSTLTNDIGRISMKMGKVLPKGELNLLTGLRIAHMVLKHRQEKHHRMRIVAFVGSPLPSEIANDLVGLAKRLKKEKVQVDIVSFGEHRGNMGILQNFIETLNGKDGTGSHILDIPRGVEMTNLLMQSPIVIDENNSAVGLTTAFEYGIDPNEDPDLALALRISMEEERQRQEAERLRTQENEAATTSQPTTSNPPPQQRNLSEMTDEEQIAYAIEMSKEPDKMVIKERPKTSSKSGCGLLKKFRDKNKKKKDK